ncbi:MAG: hypothetical protein ACR2RE_13255 [Geminicoccaceae bacterium]
MDEIASSKHRDGTEQIRRDAGTDPEAAEEVRQLIVDHASELADGA